MTNVDLLIHNAMLINEGQSYKGWLAVEGEFIVATGRGDYPVDMSAGRMIDAEGAMLLPGAIDEHVHFRDPGLTRKADMGSESAAAVMGGVTSFIDMPNTIPATVTVRDVEDKKARAAEVSVANYGFYIGATNDNLEELKQADYSEIAGVKLFLGSSTGNMLVDDESVISRIFREVPALIAVHAEDESVIRRQRELFTESSPEDLPVENHWLIRSSEACVKATRHAVELARRYDARLHVLHVSTAQELRDFSDLPVDQKHITAETCPQYLLFDNESYATLGSRIKCNPAIKTPLDRKALLEAVADGRIDCVATDHAPHLLSEKHGGALKAVSGMPMVQFSLPAMLTLCGSTPLTPERVVEVMAHNPAKIYGIDRRGFLRPGFYADLALVKPDRFTVTDEHVASRCGWTPLSGLTLGYSVVSTWVNGRQVWDGERTNDNVRGRALRFQQKKYLNRQE